jgi:hypothetical protein
MHYLPHLSDFVFICCLPEIGCMNCQTLEIRWTGIFSSFMYLYGQVAICCKTIMYYLDYEYFSIPFVLLFNIQISKNSALHIVGSCYPIRVPWCSLHKCNNNGFFYNHSYLFYRFTRIYLSFYRQCRRLHVISQLWMFYVLN